MPRNFLPSLKAPQRGNLYGYFLPKALIHLSIKVEENETKKEVFLQIHSIKHIPDPDHYYTFSYKPSANAEDDIVVKYSPSGFLSQVHTQIDDQTDEVISSLADMLSALGGDAASGMTVPGAKKTKARGTNVKNIFEGVVDPFSEEDKGLVNGKVQEVFGEGVSFDAKILGEQGESGVSGSEAERSGIFCKARAIVEIGIFSKGGKETEIVQVPHPSLLEFIEIPTARFVKTEFEITFTNEGYPNYIHINKPSSTLAFIQAPLAFVRAVFALPTSLFQFRVNLNNMKSQSIKSEYEYRRAVLDYGNRMKELEKKKDTAKTTFVIPGNTDPDKD